MLNNNHVLLSWMLMHPGVIITRYMMVHDGTTAYQRSKDKRSSKKMLPLGEKVAWMMPKDNQRRNTLEVAHQFGVFAGVVSCR